MEVARTGVLPEGEGYGDLAMRMYLWEELEDLLTPHGEVVEGAAAGVLPHLEVEEPEIRAPLQELEEKARVRPRLTQLRRAPSSASCASREQEARHLPGRRARDAGARARRRRGRRRHRRARLSVLGSPRRGAGDPARVGARARARNAHTRLPRRPRTDARAAARDPARPDDVRRHPRGLRLRALRSGRAGARRVELHPRRPPGRGAAGAPAHPARRSDLDRGADPHRRGGDRRLALPRLRHGNHRARTELSPALPPFVERVRAATDVPVYVGFGISTPELARSVAELADGVVVGSRAVEVAESGPETLRSFVASLRAAIDDS